jgi:hypothetical protein
MFFIMGVVSHQKKLLVIIKKPITRIYEFVNIISHPFSQTKPISFLFLLLFFGIKST